MAELRDSIDSLQALHALYEQSLLDHVTLLCYEKDSEPCHRHLIKDLVSDTELIRTHLEPEDTNHHKCSKISSLIAD